MKIQFFLSAFLIMLLSACGEEDPKPAAKVSEVEYRLESSTAQMATSVEYTNETGGLTSLQDVALPFSLKVKVPENMNVSMSLMAHIKEDVESNVHSLSGKILADGKQVAGQTYASTMPILNLSYAILK